MATSRVKEAGRQDAGDGDEEPTGQLPIVAIVGRPNVGKSTLFNRLIGQRQAIVEDIPGTTRDRLYAEAEWKDTRYTLIDTGGLEPDSSEGYPALIREQVEVALAEADVILFLVDAVSGITPVDVEVAEQLGRLALGGRGEGEEAEVGLSPPGGNHVR